MTPLIGAAERFRGIFYNYQSEIVRDGKQIIEIWSG